MKRIFYRDEKGRIRYSLKFELTTVLFFVVAGVIGIIILCNSFLMEGYYVADKHEALSEVYARIDAAAADGTLTSDSFKLTVVKASGRDNIGVIVMDQDSKTSMIYAQDQDTMIRRMWDNMLESTDEISSSMDKKAEQAEQNENSAGTDDGYRLVRTLRDRNGIRCQIVLDERTDEQYMEMWGILSDGSFCLLRTAIESIRNSSSVANHFFLYIGAFVMIVGFIVAYLIGNRITRPIRKLTEISQRMKKLDFSAKYDGDDRTEIAILGDNINELSSTLEKTISELKTANNELRRDLEHRDQVEKMQQEFISNVTHELKTPIALIQGYAEGLQDGIADDDRETRDFYTGVITDEAGKMNHMVQQMLNLTHLEFGQNEADMERFDIVQTIMNHLQSANLLAKHQDVRVRVTDPHNGSQDVVVSPEGRLILPSAVAPIYVWADEFLTEEVFQNYYSNALNHVEVADQSGEKIIDIRFELKDNCVRISVFNTGKPIPEDSMPRIWEKFYKVDKARTREYGGSGVGLSIVKAIMELMHQNYGAVNYDNGVEFWFELSTNVGEDK